MDEQGGIVVLVEGTQAPQLLIAELEHDAHALGQALQGDLLFQPFNLLIRDAGHKSLLLQEPCQGF